MRRWFRDVWHRMTRRRRELPECAYSPFCKGRDARHFACHRCGKSTCRRGAGIDPTTLRRTLLAACWNHDGPGRDPEQELLAERRARLDWNHEELPNQFPGDSRSTLQAFDRVEDEFEEVEDVSAGTLNGSIAALGLGDDFYAESRSRRTFLRRTPKAAK